MKKANKELEVEFLSEFLKYLSSQNLFYTQDPTEGLGLYKYDEKLKFYLSFFKMKKTENGSNYMSYSPNYVNQNFEGLTEDELINSIFFIKRAERFSSGAIAKALKDKYFHKIIQRLIDLRKK